MSTIKKLSGRSYGIMGEKRKDALRFFRERAKLPGLMGLIGRTVYRDLLAIHKASDLNGPEKDAAFKRYLQRANRSTQGLGGGQPGGEAPGLAVPAEADRVEPGQPG